MLQTPPNDQDKEINIYIDLDSVFDVKHAILTKLFPELSYLVVKDGSYYNRTDDVFKHKEYPIEIHSDLIEAFFSKRTKYDLAISSLNSLPFVLAEYLDQTLDDDFLNDPNKPVNLYINTYPYRLNDDEAKNVSLAIGQVFEREVNYETIHLPVHELTSKFFSEVNIHIALMYNAFLWMECSDKELLLKHTLHDMKIIAPRVNSKVKLSDESWKHMETLFSMISSAEFLPLSHYGPFGLYNALNENKNETNQDTVET